MLIETVSKLCKVCGEAKSLSDFYPRARRCKSCSNAARWVGGRYKDAAAREKVLAQNRASYQRNKEKAQRRGRESNRARVGWAKDLLGGRCERCGFDHPGVLQFHHRDPSLKLFEITVALMRPRQYTMEQVLEELEKCDLLCANCHEIEHWVE